MRPRPVTAVALLAVLLAACVVGEVPAENTRELTPTFPALEGTSGPTDAADQRTNGVTVSTPGPIARPTESAAEPHPSPHRTLLPNTDRTLRRMGRIIGRLR